MEVVLPKDMITEVIKYLSNQDLANYGQCSKTCLESSENEWKVRYEQLDFELKEDTSVNPLIYWMKNYTLNIRTHFSSKMSQKFNQINIFTTSEEKQLIISGIFDFILENLSIFLENSRFKKLRIATDRKLEEFLNGKLLEREVAKKYYPIIFPENYLVQLNKRNDDEGNEDNRSEVLKNTEEDF
jgi:hypothetical protein